MESSRGVTYEEATNWAKENGLLFMETSAATGECVEEAFLKTAEIILQKSEEGLCVIRLIPT